jgi:hypothetical protein
MNREQRDSDGKDCCTSLKSQLIVAQDERHEAARIGTLLLAELTTFKAKTTQQAEELNMHSAGMHKCFNITV